MTERAELTRRVAERLASAYDACIPGVTTGGGGWLAVAREALAMCGRVRVAFAREMRKPNQITNEQILALCPPEAARDDVAGSQAPAGASGRDPAQGDAPGHPGEPAATLGRGKASGDYSGNTTYDVAAGGGAEGVDGALPGSPRAAVPTAAGAPDLVIRELSPKEAWDDGFDAGAKFAACDDGYRAGLARAREIALRACKSAVEWNHRSEARMAEDIANDIEKAALADAVKKEKED